LAFFIGETQKLINAAHKKGIGPGASDGTILEYGILNLPPRYSPPCSGVLFERDANDAERHICAEAAASIADFGRNAVAQFP
jgi:hypothetical protein